MTIMAYSVCRFFHSFRLLPHLSSSVSGGQHHFNAHVIQTGVSFLLQWRTNKVEKIKKLPKYIQYLMLVHVSLPITTSHFTTTTLHLTTTITTSHFTTTTSHYSTFTRGLFHCRPLVRCIQRDPLAESSASSAKFSLLNKLPTSLRPVLSMISFLNENFSYKTDYF